MKQNNRGGFIKRLLGLAGNGPAIPSAAGAYKAGDVTRLNTSWQPPHRSGDAAIAESWDLLTSRLRDLGRNDPLVKKGKSTLVNLAIGPGIQTMADFGEGEDLLADESDEWFDRWAEEECDVAGRLTWGAMQRLAFGEAVSVGNALLLRVQDRRPGRSVPLCYQPIEWEQLDRTRDRPAGLGQNRITNGIEIDANDRPAAYWIYDAHPYDTSSSGQAGGSGSTRVDAARVLHWYLPDRSSESCGISWFSAIVQSSKDMDWYLGNELTSAAIAALLTIVTKRERPGDGQLGFEDLADDSDSFGNELVKLGHAITAEVGVDEDVTIAESKRPNRDAAPFIQLMQHVFAGGLGISYLRLTSDYKATSYTAARGAHLDDAAFVAPLQDFFGRRVVKAIRREHNAQAAAFGLYRNLSATEFARNSRRWQTFDFVPPGREQLDPEREQDAANARIRAGLSTLKIEALRRGHNWRRILRQRRRELEFADQLGVEIDLSKGGVGQFAQQTSNDTNEETVDDE